MRSLSAAAVAKVSQQYSVEPINIIEVSWSDTTRVLYADQPIERVGVRGSILAISSLDNIVDVNSSSDSQQITVTLDDTDGNVKNILDQSDVHKRPVSVYQWFPGINFADRILIFRGQVSTPIEWSEADRSVTFDIVSRIEDAEVGFSVEEGQFPEVHEDLVGKPWPLVFGTTVNTPTLALRSPRRGTLKTGFGIRDYTLEAKMASELQCCSTEFAGYTAIALGGNFNSIRLKGIYRLSPSCVCSNMALAEHYENLEATQAAFEPSELEILEGSKFAQNVPLKIQIQGAVVTGQFNGDLFTVDHYEHPSLVDGSIPTPAIRSLKGCNTGIIGFGATATNRAVFNAEQERAAADINIKGGALSDTRRCTIENGSTEDAPLVQTADFFWAEPGGEVFLLDDDEIVYVANLIESTITKVSAFRTLPSGVRQLTTVPPAYYITRISDFAQYQVTEVVMSKALSLRGGGWEDDLFVNQTSTIGPNTVDILEWLITKYTTFEIDQTSFDAVRTKLENYPSDFPLLERQNVLDVLREIAFQARCSIYLRNDVFVLKYLSETPSADDSISESDVVERSLRLTHTDTEDLVTKFIAEWKWDYAIDKLNKVILRHNVKKYGTQERTFNFYIYAHQELVIKSATFWLIRLANTWRKLRLRVPLTKLKLETFDSVDINLPDFSPSTVRSIITSANYDSNGRGIDLEIWTPVKSGSQSAYDFAYPAQVSVDLLFPTPEELDDGLGGGSGPNINVQAPEGHVVGVNALIQSFQSDLDPKRIHSDLGDIRPSDIEDVKPGPRQEGEAKLGVFPEDRDPAPQILTEDDFRQASQIAALGEKYERLNQDTQRVLDSATGGDTGGLENVGANNTNGGEDFTDDDAQNALSKLPDPADIPEDQCRSCFTIVWATVKKITGDLPCGGVQQNFPDITSETLCFNSFQKAKAESDRYRALPFLFGCINEGFVLSVGTPSLLRRGPNSQVTDFCVEPSESDHRLIGYRQYDSDCCSTRGGAWRRQYDIVGLSHEMCRLSANSEGSHSGCE